MKTEPLLLVALFGLATVNASAQPTITTPPKSQSVSRGANVSLLVRATGDEPFSYQWRFKETAVAEATASSLSLTNVQMANAGEYVVVISNAAGSITSPPATLSVDSTFTKITAGDPVKATGPFFGCAWVDYDEDGFADLFVTSRPGRNQLYRNNRDGSLAKITTGAIVTDWAEFMGCTWGDYDNDGFLDVVVGTVSGVLFYRNNGDGTFSKPANPLASSAGAYAYGSAWADFDRDGFLDLFMPSRDGNNRLYRNNGDGTFSRLTGQGTLGEAGTSISAAWGDYDNDAWPDLYVGSAFSHRAFLYRNGGNGTFTHISADPVVSTPSNWISPAWGDFNNDGLLDLFVTKGGYLSSERNALYQNQGDGTFTAITTGALVGDTGSFFGAAWGDYDNDGFLDLFVARLGGNNALYRNKGDGGFEKITAGSLGNDGGESLGCAWGDFDNDGFLDLFVANGGLNAQQRNFLYRNNGNSNQWIRVRCIGTVSNRSAIGAKVRVQAKSSGRSFWQLREISSSHGFGGDNLLAHFGLGDATIIDTLRVEWPSGIVQEFHDVPPRQLLTLTEPARLQASGPGAFRIQSWTEMTFEVQASTHLNQWSPLITVTNLTGTLEFMDPNAANQKTRFYRTVLK